jgi:glycosyltransferase involved in cell wall biosynthesis
MPVISVIMGVYSTKDLNALEQSVNSVLNQSFTDFEFIICDDCSDGYIKDFLKTLTDSRIVLISNERNLGLAASLNRCIEISHGKYIFRQDDDDISSPERFMKQFEFLEKNPDISILGSNISLFDNSGQWGVLRYPERPCRKDFLFLVPFMHGALAFRKDSLVSSGGYLSSKITRRTEDYELLMRMYSLGFTGYNLQECLYSFREDKTAHKRRKYRYKIDEFWIRLRGFKALGLMPLGLIYAVKPLIVGLIPYSLLNWFKDIYFKRKKF